MRKFGPASDKSQVRMLDDLVMGRGCTGGGNPFVAMMTDSSAVAKRSDLPRFVPAAPPGLRFDPNDCLVLHMIHNYAIVLASS